MAQKATRWCREGEKKGKEGTAASYAGSFVAPACSPNQPLPQLSLEEAFVSCKAKVC